MEENKGKGMMILVVVLLVVLSGLLVFMLITVLGMRGAANGEEIRPDVITPDIHSTRVHDLAAGSRVTNLLRGADGRAANMRMGFSIVIYRGDEGDRGDTERYEELVALLTRMEAKILHVKISYMRNLTFRDASRAEAEIIAAEALTQRLQDMFQTNLILDVVFTEFTVLAS